MKGILTKTAKDGNSVVWNAGDQIAIFQGLFQRTEAGFSALCAHQRRHPQLCGTLN